MVDRISVQIALEGGDAIEKQLADIGEAGQKAFADIAAAADKAGGFAQLKPEEVTSKLNDMGLAGTEAFTKIQAAVSKATGLEKIVQGVAGIEDAFSSLASVAVPVIGGIGAAFVALIPSTIKTAEAINKISDQAVKFGQSFAQFKKTREELAKVGIDAQGAASGLQAYQRVLGAPEVHVVNILTATGDALQYVSQTSNLAANELPKFLNQLRQMPDTIGRTNLALQQMGEAAGIEAIQGLRRAEGSMSDAEAKSYDLGQAIKNLQQAWADFGGVTLAPAITASLNFLTQQLAGVTAGIQATIQEWNAILGIMDQVAATFNTAGKAIEDATNKLLNFLGLSGTGQAGIIAAGGGGEAGTGFAGGGMIGGSGTGTSDSNLAWVSRGEHIMPAGAVAQPGVMAFLEALRRSGGNLSAVLNGMGRFALGGMVPAAGGGMSHVTIAFPGLPAIGGLRASAAVVDQLRHAAALAQVRSGGRKPSRYT